MFEYLKIQNIRQIQYLQYLLYIKSQGWSETAMGNGLAYLTLIPDAKINAELKSRNGKQNLIFNWLTANS